MLLSRLTICKFVSSIGWALEVNIHMDMGRHASGSSARSSEPELPPAGRCLPYRLLLCVSSYPWGHVGCRNGRGAGREKEKCLLFCRCNCFREPRWLLRCIVKEGAQASTGPMGRSASLLLLACRAGLSGRPSPYVELSDLKTQEFKHWFEGIESHILTTLKDSLCF